MKLCMSGFIRKYIITDLKTKDVQMPEKKHNTYIKINSRILCYTIVCYYALNQNL